MPYRLRGEDADLETAVRRIAFEQIDRAILELDDPALDRHEAVHQIRKRCKKLRGLLRLVRGACPDYAAENAAFREMARSISGLRDTQALIEAYDALAIRAGEAVDRQAMGLIRRRLTLQQKEAGADDAALEAKLGELRKGLVSARKRAERWRVEQDGFAAIAPGLEKTYRRARLAMADARRAGTPRQFHEWRKRVKYHWYHMRLLKELWPAEMAAREGEADRLGELLGDDHDLAVFRQSLLDDPQAYGDLRTVQIFVELLDARRHELQAQAQSLGARLLAEKPRRLVRRLDKYWTSWQAERDKAAPSSDTTARAA